MEYFRTTYERYRSNLNPRFVGNFRPARKFSCRYVHYLAGVMRERASEARKVWERYADEWNWRSWLPPVWKAIIQCETFSNFRHDSGTYQGAFGFHRSSWDAFRLPGYPSEAYEANPRQQFNVALAIHARYGFSGWGCA